MKDRTEMSNDPNGNPQKTTDPSLTERVLALRTNMVPLLRTVVVPFVLRSLPGLAAGLLGALAATFIMGVLRLTLGSPTLPELVGERILPTMSAGNFVALLLQFSPHQKTGPLSLALLGQIALGLLIGPLYVIISREYTPVGRWPARRGLLTAAGIALAMEVVATALFWPVLAEGTTGDPVGRARLLTLFSMALIFVTFAGVTMLANHWLAGAWPSLTRTSGLPQNNVAAADPVLERREALRTAGLFAVAVVVGGLGISRLIDAYLSRSNLSYEGIAVPVMDTDPITKPEDFYVVSKNALDPEVAVGRWQLEIGGLVKQSLTWNYQQLRALPSESRAITMECISNQVGGRLMSTAAWTGVPLKTILDAAGIPDPAGKHVAFFSVDGFASSLPLADVLEAQALLAWDMNGAPLPPRHGFPLRVVMPGRYGEQSPKWLTRIEVIDYDYKGFYQSQGWNAGQLSTTSRFDFPQAGTVALSGPNAPTDRTVRGIAFAGIRGIQRVEVSADAGQTWSDATLSPAQSIHSWVFWRWQQLQPGDYTLVVRATDGTGTVQTTKRRGTVPQGSTGRHTVTVQVTA